MYCIYIYKSGKRTPVCLSRTTVMLVWTYMIYVRYNVVQNAGHYRENRPVRANRTTTQSGGVLLRPEGYYFR